MLELTTRIFMMFESFAAVYIELHLKGVYLIYF